MKKFLNFSKGNPELIISGIAYLTIAIVAYQLIEVSMLHAITVAIALAVMGLCDRIGVKKSAKLITGYRLCMKKYNN